MSAPAPHFPIHPAPAAGYPTARRPWHRAGSLALGATMALNGMTMLLGPQAWYGRLPTVAATGPLNTHFVRDIGCAYLLSGVGLLVASRGGQRAQGMGWMAALFLLMHAGVHLYEVAAGLCGWSLWWRTVPTVTVPALLALWLAAWTPDAAWGPRRGAAQAEQGGW